MRYWVFPWTTTIMALAVSSMASVASADDPVVASRQFELGVGWLSDKSARFGRYNGMDSDGAYAIGNIDLRLPAEDGYYARITGTNLGLDSRYLRVDGGAQGRVEGFIEYDQFNLHAADDGVGPFRGGNRLRLPGDWVPGNSTAEMTSLDSSLHSLDLGTERKRLGAGLSIIPLKYWNIGVKVHREEKNGTLPSAAAMAYRSAAAILPVPVDYTTDDFEAVIGYSRDRGQFQLKYHMSLFSDNNNALQWDNPYALGMDTGRMALPPDNQFHQLAVSGGYRLPHRTRVTGLLSVARMTQDDNFLPYATTAGLSPALPRSDLNGKVTITTGRFALNSRPLPKWDYNLSLRYYDRNNDTPRNDYSYVITDLFTGGTRRNNPYSYRQQKISTSVGYRLATRTRFVLAYDFEDTERNQSEVNNTREHTVKASLRTRFLSEVSGSLYIAGSTRDQSGSYTALSRTTNPLLRVSYLAKRDETRTGASLNYTPGERFSVNMKAAYVQAKYKQSKIGLKQTTHPTYSLDASYTPGKNLSTYAYYTYDGDVAKQNGSRVGAEADWRARTDDASDTYGVGAKWREAMDHLDLGVDYVYNRSEGSIGVGADGAYPDRVNRLKSLQLYASYPLSRSVRMKLDYRHEKYNSSNWSIDGVAPASIDQVLGFGLSSPSYSQNVYMLSFLVKLD